MPINRQKKNSDNSFLWKEKNNSPLNLLEGVTADLHLPESVYFHDTTLRDMVAQQPTSHGALLEVSGVGQAKLTRYGDAFLDVISAHRQRLPIADDRRPKTDNR